MIDIMTVIVSLCGVGRILTYQRHGAHYDVIAAFAAWLLMVGGFGLAMWLLSGGQSCLLLLLIVVVLVGMIFKNKGNIARLIKR